jgi:hypothetical protein
VLVGTLRTEPDSFEIERTALRAVEGLGIGIGFRAAGFFEKYHRTMTFGADVIADHIETDICPAVGADGEYFEFWFLFLKKHVLSSGKSFVCRIHDISVTESCQRDETAERRFRRLSDWPGSKGRYRFRLSSLPDENHLTPAGSEAIIISTLVIDHSPKKRIFKIEKAWVNIELS